MSKQPPQQVRDIVDRIEQRPANPIRRARMMVEQEVPVSRRGPGWDRHWRELEAYLDEGCEWRSKPPESSDYEQKKGRSNDQP